MARPTPTPVPPASVAPQVAEAPPPEPSFAQPPSDAPTAAPPPVVMQEPAHRLAGAMSGKKGKKSFDGGGGERDLAFGSDKAALDSSLGESRDSTRRYAQPPPNAGASGAAVRFGEGRV